MDGTARAVLAAGSDRGLTDLWVGRHDGPSSVEAISDRT
jgi:hypothetical protein